MDNLLNGLLDAGGTAAVAAIFLWYLDRESKRTTILISNHLAHSTDAMEKMSNALTKLSSTLESFIKSAKKADRKV